MKEKRTISPQPSTSKDTTKVSPQPPTIVMPKPKFNIRHADKTAPKKPPEKPITLQISMPDLGAPATGGDNEVPVAHVPPKIDLQYADPQDTRYGDFSRTLIKAKRKYAHRGSLANALTQTQQGDLGCDEPFNVPKFIQRSVNKFLLKVAATVPLHDVQRQSPYIHVPYGGTRYAINVPIRVKNASRMQINTKARVPTNTKKVKKKVVEEPKKVPKPPKEMPKLKDKRTISDRKELSEEDQHMFQLNERERHTMDKTVESSTQIELFGHLSSDDDEGGMGDFSDAAEEAQLAPSKSDEPPHLVKAEEESGTVGVTDEPPFLEKFAEENIPLLEFSSLEEVLTQLNAAQIPTQEKNKKRKKTRTERERSENELSLTNSSFG